CRQQSPRKAAKLPLEIRLVLHTVPPAPVFFVVCVQDIPARCHYTAKCQKAQQKTAPYGKNRKTRQIKRSLGQYRIILSADTASEGRQMLSQKRR
ncbi:MAG: hypothetical protein SPJ00_06370, partial [Gemmiger sp.]|nr:hypothetical protein [Gemmiger sp.]